MGTNRRRTRNCNQLSRQDVDFICTIFDEHINLIKNRRSLPYDGNLEKQRQTSYRVIHELDTLNVTQKTYLDKETLEFIRFSIDECVDLKTECEDFMPEFSAPYMLRKGAAILNKLQTMNGLNLYWEEDGQACLLTTTIY